MRLAPLLHSYTGGVPVVAAHGATIGELMDDLDRQFPGIAFRIMDEQGRVRRHMNVFVGENSVRERSSPVPDGCEVFVVGALSGG